MHLIINNCTINEKQSINYSLSYDNDFQIFVFIIYNSFLFVIVFVCFVFRCFINVNLLNICLYITSG